jgi:S-adenosylmethionine synthetase
MTMASRVTVSHGDVLAPSARRTEIVERKGLGHPDTMADLVAEVFCHRYARHCLDTVGLVPNHSADKVTLAGADTVVRLGGYDVVTPIQAYYFGKVTRRVAGVALPVEEIFDAAVDDVLALATRYPGIREHTAKHVRAVVGHPIDHHPGYYQPVSVEQLQSIATTERFANDTVACSGTASPTGVEQLVLDLERRLQGPGFTAEVPGTGSDIKVLAIRDGAALDVTVCLPFHPEEIPSWREYDARLEHARKLVLDFVESRPVPGVDDVTLHLNGRDVPGRGYLAPFGTCLGKGDVGAVGRGNRYSGLISSSRTLSVEAPAGKNVMHHTGKLYTVLAGTIAEDIRDRLGVEAEVTVTSRVGQRLELPSAVVVSLYESADRDDAIRDLVAEHLAAAGDLSDRLIRTDPLAAVRSAYEAA